MDSNHRPRDYESQASAHKADDHNDLGKPEILRAQGRAQNCPETAPEAPATDPELAAIVAAWPMRPEATRRRIVAMVEASQDGSHR